MAQTITPVVHGGRGARWAKVIALHVVGATASAALLGAALGAAGAALGAPWGLLGAAVVVTVVVGTFGVARSAAVAAAWLAAGDRDVDALTEALERLAVRPWARILNGAALVAVAMFGAAAATSTSLPSAERIAPVAASVLALVFGLAAASKVARWGNWRRAVATYRIPAPLATAIVVPVGEASVPAAILAGAPAAGAALALFLLLAFTVAALRAARSVGDRLPCGCFGGSRSRSVRFILARNIGLAILAATAAGAGPSPVPSFGPGDALPALLAAIGVALTGALVVRASRLIRRDRAYGQG